MFKGIYLPSIPSNSALLSEGYAALNLLGSKRRLLHIGYVAHSARKSLFGSLMVCQKALTEYKTEGYAQSRRDRKKVEMLFGHMKRILKLTRLRLRGITGAQDEFLMAATTQNLRRMAMWLSPGPPGHRVSAPA